MNVPRTPPETMPLVYGHGAQDDYIHHPSVDAHFDLIPSSSAVHVDVSPPDLSDAGSGPRTPPMLLNPADLPADPKHAIWALAQQHAQQQRPVKKLQKATPSSSFPTKSLAISSTQTTTPPAPPTISTFSASSLNHIHIVQPYVHTQDGSPNAPASKPADAKLSSATTSKSASANHNNNNNNNNGCSTSTFSVHPTPFSFANPYCTNALHDFLPGMAKPGATTAGVGGQPPRPANAWILYRSDKMKGMVPEPGQPRQPQADISKLIAAMWKNENPEVRAHYEALSDMKKAEHLALYPGYRFQPMKKADKDKFRAEKKAEKEREKLASLSLRTHRKATKSTSSAKQSLTREGTEEALPTPTTADGVMSFQGWPTTNTTVTATSPTSHGPALAPAPSATSPLSPTRSHMFSYQPYALPTGVGGSNSANGAAAKRKRLRTKVEVPTPSLPSEESSYGEYVPPTMDANAHYYTGQESGIEYSSYDGSHMQHMQPGFGTMSATPQLSVGPSSNPSSHTTPPFSTVDPNVASGRAAQHPQMVPQPPNAVSAILEPVAGQHDIFEFSGLDANNLLNQMEIAISLPDDFLVDGLGLGLGEGGFTFDGADTGGGFAEFSNLASFDGLATGSGDSGVNFGDYSMDPNALSLNEGMPAQHYPPQTLHINTQFTSSDPSTIPLSAVSEQFNVTSPSQPSASDGSFYGPFAHQQPHYQHQHAFTSPQQAYHQHHAFSHHPPQAFMTSHGYTSPTQSNAYASPPPQSAVDENSVSGTPISETLPSASGAIRGNGKMAMKRR
ncbi:hypothetical protein CPB86DRAFT_811111 [Serendipita vermifera]|nr:hypothetical protein CPB86DRAFT_811111 [Serendipita vermifera]